MKRGPFLTCLILVLSVIYTMAQGIDCDNSIDLIVPTSLFPNPSFEDEVGGCIIQSGWSEAHCAQGWGNPSDGTPDYYYRCNQMQHALLPIADCPVPDGDRFFGFADNWTGQGAPEKEYVGTKLTSPLQSGERYVLSVWVGYIKQHASWTSPAFDLTIFGNTDPDVMETPFRGRDCPTAPSSSVDTSGDPINPWDQVTILGVDDFDGDYWTQVRIEFIPNDDYASIIIGPSCNRVSGLHYYFVDNLVLSAKSEFSNDFIIVQSGQACKDDLVLEVPDIDGVDYQWYQDQDEIPGATSRVLEVDSFPQGDGDYVCVISNEYGCMRSDPFTVDERSRTFEIEAPAGFCDGESVRIGTSEDLQSFEWKDGLGQDPWIDVDQPGTYVLQAVDDEGCDLVDTLILDYFPDIQYTSHLTKESAPGAGDGRIRLDLEQDAINPVVTWWDDRTDNPRSGLAEGDYCFTINADNRCPIEECIFLPQEVQPIVIDARVTQVRCHGENSGAISVEFSGGLEPFEVEWLDHPEWNGQSDLSDLSAGQYIFRITDGEGTIEEREITVQEPEPLMIALDGQSPSCAGDEDAVVFVRDLSGGNGAYELYWNGSSTAGPQRLEDQPGGVFTVRVVDSSGCESGDEIKLPDPDPITPDFIVEPSHCAGADDGMISIENIQGGTGPFRFFVDGMESDMTITDLIGDESYDISLVDANGCTYNEQVFIENEIDFTVDIGEDREVEEYFDVQVISKSDEELALYSWSNTLGYYNECSDCPLLSYEMSESHDVILLAESEDGCIAADTVHLSMTPSKRIYIPNAISLNGDGVNDEFRLFNADQVETVQFFRLFDRTGVKLIDVSDRTRDDAINLIRTSMERRDLPPAVYVYAMQVGFLDGTTGQYQGDVTVIR